MRSLAGAGGFLFLLLWTGSVWGDCLIYGPKRFDCPGKKALSVSQTFPSPGPENQYRVVVRNGDTGANLASTIQVKLNKTLLFKKKDFKLQGNRAEKTVRLQRSNNLALKIKGPPGSFITVTVECIDCLDLAITDPAGGSTVITPRVLVRGVVLASSDHVGVAVDGRPAELNGHDWAGWAYLEPGPGIITARVSDNQGRIAEKSVAVTGVASPAGHEVRVSPAMGLAPLTVTFRVTRWTGPILQSVEIDYDGDDVFDETHVVFDEFSHTYLKEGVYTPRVKVTDSNGQVQESVLFVSVLDPKKMEAHLTSKWTDVVSALASRDVERALLHFHSDTQDAYRTLFAALGQILPDVAAKMAAEKILMVSVNADYAEFEILSTRSGKLYSFPLKFIREESGVWKVWRY
jgi:hypothetical protein